MSHPSFGPVPQSYSTLRPVPIPGPSAPRIPYQKLFFPYVSKPPKIFIDLTEQTSIFTLPAEIHLLIINKCTPIDRARLRLTNRYFQSTIAAPKPRDVQKFERQINNAHDYPQVLWCSYGNHLRPLSKFADNLYEICRLKSRKDVFRIQHLTAPISTNSGLINGDPPCIDCAIQNKWEGYKSGEVIVVQDAYHVVCTWCGKCKPLAGIDRPGICHDCADLAYRHIIRRQQGITCKITIGEGIRALEDKLVADALKDGNKTQELPDFLTKRMRGELGSSYQRSVLWKNVPM